MAIIAFICAGVNPVPRHISAMHNDVELNDKLPAARRRIRGSRRLKRIDVMKRFGCFSTESNGLLAEYAHGAASVPLPGQPVGIRKRNYQPGNGSLFLEPRGHTGIKLPCWNYSLFGRDCERSLLKLEQSIRNRRKNEFGI